VWKLSGVLRKVINITGITEVKKKKKKNGGLRSEREKKKRKKK